MTKQIMGFAKSFDGRAKETYLKMIDCKGE